MSGSAFATTGSPSSVLEYQQAASQTDTKLAPSTEWHNTIRMGHGNPYSYYSNTLAMRMTGGDSGTIFTQVISNNSAQGWRKVWDSGNDGSGSGLDADTVDGVDSLSFKRNDQTGVTAEFSKWYSTSSHVYSNSVSTYYWIHLGTMGGASKGSIEYEFKTDENYPHFVKGTIAFSSFSGGSSFGVQHDQHSPDRFAVQVRLDTSRRIWIRAAGVAWSHFFRFRTHHATGSFTTNTSFSVGTGKLTSVPANSSSDINGGHNLRASNTSVTGSVPTYTDNYHRFPNLAVHHNVTIAGNTAWHAGNDGSGSGLDADTVDGVQASNMVQLTGTQDITGVKHFRSNGDTASITNPPLQAYAQTNSNGAIMAFHRSGHYAVNMGLDSDNVLRIGGWSASANRLQMDMSGNLTMAGNVTAYSDIRLKENIEVIPDALDKVQQIRGVTFTRNDVDDLEQLHTGVIAQEVETVLPMAVSEDNSGVKNVAYGNMVGLLIEAIKELKTEVDDLKTQLAEKG